MTESIERPADTAPESTSTVVVDSVDPIDPHDAVIAEALGVIDEALGTMVSRELVSSGEVADLLLDLRTALTAPLARS